MSGIKHDVGKVSMDLIPPILNTALAKVLTWGATKYAPYNWLKGLNYSQVYSALQRHLNAWWGGESNDPESGMSHLWHATANVTFLLTFEHYKRGTDDRMNWIDNRPPATVMPGPGRRHGDFGKEF